LACRLTLQTQKWENPKNRSISALRFFPLGLQTYAAFFSAWLADLRCKHRKNDAEKGGTPHLMRMWDAILSLGKQLVVLSFVPTNKICCNQKKYAANAMLACKARNTVL